MPVRVSKNKKKEFSGCSFFLSFVMLFLSMSPCLLLMLLYVHGIPWSIKRGAERASKQRMRCMMSPGLYSCLFCSLTKRGSDSNWSMLLQPKQEINKNCIACIWALGRSSTAQTGQTVRIIFFSFVCLDWIDLRDPPVLYLFWCDGHLAWLWSNPIEPLICICQWPDDRGREEETIDFFVVRKAKKRLEERKKKKRRLHFC